MVAQTLLLLNPSRRKRRKSTKHRTAAQRAATRKLVALNRRRRGKSGKSSSINFKVNTMKRRSRRYRRNPSARGRGLSLSTAGAMSIVKPAAVGAVGALSVNLIMNQLGSSLPATLTDGKMNYVTRAAVAMLLGVFGGKVPGLRPYARNMAQGSLTVTLSDLGREVAAGAGINLAGMGRVGYINPGFIATPWAAGRGNIPGTMGRVGQYVPALPNPLARANMAGMRGRVGQYIQR